MLSKLTYIALCCMLLSCRSTKIYSSIPVAQDADTLISSALAKVVSDTCVYDDLQMEVVRLSMALQECRQQAIMIVNPKKSFNQVVKNSNNTTEVYRLRKSLQVKSDSLAYLQAENFALAGKVKELAKKSTTGANSPNIAKSGNTTKKADWYIWIIIFVAGGITSQAVRIIVKSL